MGENKKLKQSNKFEIVKSLDEYQSWKSNQEFDEMEKKFKLEELEYEKLTPNERLRRDFEINANLETLSKMREGYINHGDAVLDVYEASCLNALIRLFFEIRAEMLALNNRTNIIDEKSFKFMAFHNKKSRELNEKIDELSKIGDYLKGEITSFVLHCNSLDSRRVCEELTRMQEINNFISEELNKLDISLSDEIMNRLESGEKASKILDDMYDKIVEEVKEIEDITPKDVDEYKANQDKLLRYFWVY